MRDDYGRDIRYLRLSVTDRCNCRCVYCMPENGVPMLSHADILSFEEMRDIVAAAASLGVRKVRLTGGEPLVRRGIVDLVGMVASVPGIEEVDMTTNATLLAPIAGDLCAAGLTRLNVSLDTLDAARYEAITRRGSLADALAGLEAAHAAGFTNTKINCVLVGGVNDDELRPLAELARDRDLTVRFIELMRMGECADWPRGRFVSADEVLSAVPELAPVGGQGEEKAAPAQPSEDKPAGEAVVTVPPEQQEEVAQDIEASMAKIFDPEAEAPASSADLGDTRAFDQIQFGKDYEIE